jgi:hypothetical protein
MASLVEYKSRVSFALVVASVAAGWWLPGCGSSLESAVQKRAAGDFECTAKGVEVQEVGRSRYHARGCGKDGDYVCSSTPDGVDCSLDTDLDVESPSTLATATAPEASSTAPAL